MPNKDNSTQYSLVAREAYLFILEKKINDFELAYLEAAKKIINSEIKWRGIVTCFNIFPSFR